MEAGTQQAVTAERTKALGRIFEQAGAIGGAIVAELLPGSKVLFFDREGPGSPWQVFILDTNKGFGLSALYFSVASSGEIPIAYVRPGGALQQGMPFRNGRVLDAVIESVEQVLARRPQDVLILPKAELEKVYDRVAELAAITENGKRFICTPLGSLTIKVSGDPMNLDGSPQYQVELFHPDPERSRSIPGGRAVVRKQFGFDQKLSSALSRRDLDQLLTFAEIQRDLRASA